MEPRAPVTQKQLCQDKPVVFSNKTLLGNWFEERCKYTKDNYKHNSLYRTDYTPQHPKECLNILEISNAAKESGDIAISPARISDECPSYFENYSTLYDLAFEHFPCWYKGTIERKVRFALLQWEPTNEYLNSYGNLSERHNLHTEEWNCDGLDPRKTTHSIYNQFYTKPDRTSYKFTRWTRPSPVKITCKNVTNIVHKPFPNNHPRTLEQKCNPIIWECKGDNSSGHTCLCDEKKQGSYL